MAISRETEGSERQRRAHDYTDAIAGAADEVKRRGKETLEQGKDAAASRTERLAQTVERAAEGLDNENRTLAAYASQLADGMHRMADSLRDRSVNELAADVQGLAKRNPMLFLAGSVALGVALTRFMKASAHREDREGLAEDYGYEGATPPTPGERIPDPSNVSGSPPPAH